MLLESQKAVQNCRSSDVISAARYIMPVRLILSWVHNLPIHSYTFIYRHSFFSRSPKNIMATAQVADVASAAAITNVASPAAADVKDQLQRYDVVDFGGDGKANVVDPSRCCLVSRSSTSPVLHWYRIHSVSMTSDD